jgi:hypothetical protein
MSKSIAISNDFSKVVSLFSSALFSNAANWIVAFYADIGNLKLINKGEDNAGNLTLQA